MNTQELQHAILITCLAMKTLANDLTELEQEVSLMEDEYYQLEIKLSKLMEME